MHVQRPFPLCLSKDWRALWLVEGVGEEEQEMGSQGRGGVDRGSTRASWAWADDACSTKARLPRGMQKSFLPIPLMYYPSIVSLNEIISRRADCIFPSRLVVFPPENDTKEKKEKRHFYCSLHLTSIA